MVPILLRNCTTSSCINKRNGKTNIRNNHNNHNSNSNIRNKRNSRDIRNLMNGIIFINGNRRRGRILITNGTLNNIILGSNKNLNIT